MIFSEWWAVCPADATSLFNRPLTNYLRMIWSDHRIIKIGRHTDGNYQSDVHFVIAQGTLFW